MSQTTHYELVIEASSPDTGIWLADDEGFLVQKETGSLSTGLLPGVYVVEFGLGTPQYEIVLDADSHFTEAELTAGEPTERRIPQI